MQSSLSVTLLHWRQGSASAGALQCTHASTLPFGVRGHGTDTVQTVTVQTHIVLLMKRGSILNVGFAPASKLRLVENVAPQMQAVGVGSIQPDEDATQRCIEPPNELVEPRRFSFRLRAVGVSHHAGRQIASALPDGTPLQLARDPHNVVDRRAIQVRVASTEAVTECVDGSSCCLAHLEWQSARELAPALDTGFVDICSATMEGERRLPYEFGVKVVVNVRCKQVAASLEAADSLHGRKLISFSASMAELDTIAQNDVRTAEAAAQTTALCQTQRAWEPAAGISKRPTASVHPLPVASAQPPPVSTSDTRLDWDVYNPEVHDPKPLTAAEATAAQASGWPPSDTVLMRLGLGPASDAAWWAVHGMKPPFEWDLVGAIDLLLSSSLQTSSNRQRAAEVLDGGVHSATPWLPSTLDAVYELMRSPAFWLKRKAECYIRAFGGP